MSIATLSGQAGELSVTFETGAGLVRTWQDFKLSKKARWIQHDVHLSQPLSEFLGPGLASLSMSVRLDMQLGIHPGEELDTLRAMRDLGQVSTLVVGGELVADFKIDEAAEDWRRVDNKGVVQLVVVDLQLGEYV